jgi:anti-sigma-K factor RskA
VDLSCIISSGDLELYILGMLPEEEANKITQLAILFPEVQEELNRISESLEALGSVGAAPPSASVKDNIMGKLAELKKEEQKVVPFGSYNKKKIETGNEQMKIPVVDLPNKANKSSWLLAASFIGLIFSLGTLFYFISQNNRSQTELASLKQQADTLRQNAAVQQQQILAYSATMQMLHSDNYKKIELTNVPGKPSAMAQVMWDTKTKEVYVADVSLPQTPSDKQYQLWAIVDGKPVDAGMLSDVKNMAQKMKVFEKADAFAITLEKKGGSPIPTMEEMYVMGKV